MNVPDIYVSIKSQGIKRKHDDKDDDEASDADLEMTAKKQHQESKTPDCSSPTAAVGSGGGAAAAADAGPSSGPIINVQSLERFAARMKPGPDRDGIIEMLRQQTGFHNQQ